MAWMSALLGPSGPGFLGRGVDENSRRYLDQGVMKRQERRGLEGDGSFSKASGTEEDRAESAQQSIDRRQVRRPVASTAQDDQLLLEQEILRHHGSYTTGAAKLRGHDGEVKQGEQEVLHLQVSVGQTSGAAQRCRIQDSARELAIRDHRRRLLSPLASAGVACCRSSAVKTGTPG